LSPGLVSPTEHRYFLRPDPHGLLVVACFLLCLAGLFSLLAREAHATADDLDLVLQQLRLHEPATALAAAPYVEVDSRRVPWSTIRRLASEAGLFLPPYRPVSAGELTTLLLAIAAADGSAAYDVAERRILAHWLGRYGLGESGRVWRGCACREHPPAGRLSGHGTLRWAAIGDVADNEAGLTQPAGLNGVIEPTLGLWSGSWWGLAAPRLQTLLQAEDRAVATPLTFTDWPIATHKPALGAARRAGDDIRVDWPTAVVGTRRGLWSLTAGWAPRFIGPGTGSLLLGYAGESFFGVTARRTAPFAWKGLLARVAPKHLLVRVGVLSNQVVSVPGGGSATTVLGERNPYLFQWLLTFNHSPWIRTTLVHSAIASARSGTLWPDVFQVNFPLLSATWAESDRGPVTDRLFAMQFEAIVQYFPWLLPENVSARLYWDYGGEDFSPDDLLGITPQISLPASVLGGELVSPRWDLAAEFAMLDYDAPVWYSHPGFAAGYSHNGWILGHTAGGTGSSRTGWLRLRPWGFGWEFVVRGHHTECGASGRTPGVYERDAVTVTVNRTVVSLPWSCSVGWFRERYSPWANDGASAREEWFSTQLRVEY